MERGRERYWRQVREIRDAFGVPTDEARDLWREYYDYGGDPVKPLRQLQLNIEPVVVSEGASLCPLCRDVLDVDLGDITFACPGCSTTYHAECWDEFGSRCSTLGCSRPGASRDQVRVRVAQREVLEGGRRILPLILIPSVVVVVVFMLYYMIYVLPRLLW